MGDCISRAALLAAYDAAHVGPPGEARKLIEEAPAVTVPEWISVEERLPVEKNSNPNKSVLAIEIREGLAREWTWDSVARYPKSFTHWMPLPSAPEVEV